MRNLVVDLVRELRRDYRVALRRLARRDLLRVHHRPHDYPPPVPGGVRLSRPLPSDDARLRPKVRRGDDPRERGVVNSKGRKWFRTVECIASIHYFDPISSMSFNATLSPQGKFVVAPASSEGFRRT